MLLIKKQNFSSILESIIKYSCSKVTGLTNAKFKIALAGKKKTQVEEYQLRA